MTEPTTPTTIAATVKTPAHTPEQIAARLSPAQKRAIMMLPEDGSYADEYTSPPWPNLHMRAELARLGEMRPNTRFRHGFRLTPLGLEVRAALSAATGEA